MSDNIINIDGREYARSEFTDEQATLDYKIQRALEERDKYKLKAEAFDMAATAYIRQLKESLDR